MAKGWFYPAGCFVNLDWSKQEREDDYHTYLSTFGHEQFHYLQFVGTSFGQFLFDLDEIWVSKVISAVQHGIRRSRSPRFDLRRWAASESDPQTLHNLQEALHIHDICRRTSEIALDGGFLEDLYGFTRLYRKVLGFQKDASRPIWKINPADADEPTDIEIEGAEGWFGARAVMEASASLHQAFNVMGEGEEIPPGAPPDVACMLRNADRSRSLSRIERTSRSSYSEAIVEISGLLPQNTLESAYTFFILADLALMPPIGRYHGTCTQPPNLTDLLPGYRILKAAMAVKRLGITARDLAGDYDEIIDAICVDSMVRWPQPMWLAMNAKKLSLPHEHPSGKVLMNWHLKAAAIRRQTPHIFSFPRAPLIDDLRIPIVYLRDDIKIGCSMSDQVSILAVFFRKACADIWVTGSMPKQLPDVPDLRVGIRETFRTIFGLSLDEVVKQ